MISSYADSVLPCKCISRCKAVATIWEAYLSSAFREPLLAMDANMTRLWVGIEDDLLTHFPAVKQITTPFRDPQFPDTDYQAFLASLDYEPVAKAAWGKHIP